MALNANTRTDVLFNALAAANPKIGTDLNQAERDTMRAQLLTLFGADTGYLVSNATILPGSMVAPAGATVQVAVPAGSGAVTSPSPVLSGVGRLS